MTTEGIKEATKSVKIEVTINPKEGIDVADVKWQVYHFLNDLVWEGKLEYKTLGI